MPPKASYAVPTLSVVSRLRTLRNKSSPIHRYVPPALNTYFNNACRETCYPRSVVNETKGSEGKYNANQFNKK